MRFSRFYLECTCNSMWALLLVRAGLIPPVPPVGFQKPSFVSSGQVKPGLGPLWPLVWKEDNTISSETLDVHRSLHNEQSKGILPWTLFKRITRSGNVRTLIIGHSHFGGLNTDSCWPLLQYRLIPKNTHTDFAIFRLNIIQNNNYLVLHFLFSNPALGFLTLFLCLPSSLFKKHRERSRQ